MQLNIYAANIYVYYVMNSWKTYEKIILINFAQILKNKTTKRMNKTEGIFFILLKKFYFNQFLKKYVFRKVVTIWSEKILILEKIVNIKRWVNLISPQKSMTHIFQKISWNTPVSCLRLRGTKMKLWNSCCNVSFTFLW